MALTTCPDCGKEVSSRAPSCPNCGAPIGGTPPSVHGGGEGCFLKTMNVGCAVVLGSVLLIGVMIVSIDYDDTDPAAATVDGAGAPMHFLTGCADGVLEVADINLWDSPQRSRVVGSLTGTSVEECNGAVVFVHETRPGRGPEQVRVTSIVNGLEGWVSDHFVGAALSYEGCQEYFRDEPEIAARCTPDVATQ